jgi:hypothetical protein
VLGRMRKRKRLGIGRQRSACISVRTIQDNLRCFYLTVPRAAN